MEQIRNGIAYLLDGVASISRALSEGKYRIPLPILSSYLISDIFVFGNGVIALTQSYIQVCPLILLMTLIRHYWS